MNKNKAIENEIYSIINTCDQLIHEERFDELVSYYTDNAILVVKPDTVVYGREEIKNSFIKIAKYFDNSIKPIEGKMIYLISGDTVLVLAQTFLEASEKATEQSEFSMERRATYVFRLVNNQWLCAIDNSYGTNLVE
ncbi:nuclear transport factor 2 family protein [Enterococcus entomosocium]|uniref:YybH family protein n=1 Tax=Enterococcus entomosocium TaxID=3034352 RepID=UPI003D6B0C2F